MTNVEKRYVEGPRRPTNLFDLFADRPRDRSFAVISRVPLATIEPFKKRLGWNFRWLSSARKDFNDDFHVTLSRIAYVRGSVA